MSRKGKAGPYSVWLMAWSLETWRHHSYGKKSEAVRVAKKRKPSNGYAFVKDVHGTIVWSSKGFEELETKLKDVVFDMLEES